ncbi:MAG: hypothetical protein KGZ59_07190 [Chitinophagaceae bacterium]|nr:hypothetical protein [Chitinophagaceae bacterium]
MKKLINYSFMALFLLVGASSCTKNNLVVDKTPIVTPAPYAEMLFTSFTAKPYNLVPPTPTAYAIPIGVTSVASVDRTVNFTYTSSTGAVAGTHYNAPASITIKAGQAIDTLKVTGILAPYTTGRIDTLMVKISSGAIPAFPGKDSIKLVIQRYCPVVLAAMGGAYNDTKEYNAAGALQYGPYTVSCVNLVMVPGSTTRATCKFTNLYDWGWNDISAELDWTNPSNFRVIIPQQPTGGVGAGNPPFVRGSTTKSSTFSSCDNSITLYCDLLNSSGGVTTANYEFRLRR